MAQAFKCDNCDVFYDEEPAAKVVFDGPPSSPVPKPTPDKHTADLCTDCWCEHIEVLGLGTIDE